MSRMSGDFRFATRTGMLVAIASVLIVCGMHAQVARAAAVNAISNMAISLTPGTSPANSLPSETGGTSYIAPTDGSTSPQALSDDNLTEAFSFNYGGTSADLSSDGSADQTLQTLTLGLPPAVLDRLAPVAAFCTPADLGTMPSYDGSTPATGWLFGGSGCPASSQIGELVGQVYVPSLSATLPITGNLYIMEPTAPGDVAMIGAEVDVTLAGVSTPTVISSGPIDFALTSDGQPQLTAALALPAEADLVLPGLGSLGSLPYTLESLTETINGLTPAGAIFQTMPGSDATATGTAAAVVQANGDASATAAGTTIAGASGSASAALTPTGAASLPYAPQLTTSVVRDAGDPIIAFTNTITQAATEAPSSSITLDFPSNILQAYGPNALYEVCQNPAASDANCTQVGTVTAGTPLLSSPLVGALYLTGEPLSPSLVIRFPAPFAISIQGTVDLASDSVTFPTVPDMPLTSLAVAITGGSNGIFETTCTTSSSTGSVTGALIGQNGATASPSGAFSISGCPAPAATSTSGAVPIVPATPPTVGSAAATTPSPFATTTTPAKPTTTKPTVQADFVAAGTLTGFTTGARMTLVVVNEPGSPAFHVIRLTPPSGTHFVAKNLARNVTVGASSRKPVISHGQLVITLYGDAVETKLAITRDALALTKAQSRNIRAGKVKKLLLHVALVTTRKTTERSTTTLTVRR